MEISAELFGAFIKRGDIYHSPDFEGINHGKFFVVMGVSENKVCGFFFINTNIDSRIMSKQHLLDLQYTLRKDDYGFLHHNSFLNASSLNKISIDWIANGLKEERTKIIGRMREEHIKEILNMVLKSEVFSEIEKKTYFS